jgi:hypothetical protein
LRLIIFFIAITPVNENAIMMRQIFIWNWNLSK